MQFKDYYAIMSVARDASPDDIKRAYRKLARKYHPDVSKEADAEVRFKDLGEAYEVLKDPEKRAAYDQLGKDYRPGQEFRPPPDWDGGFEYADGAGSGQGFSDFFEELFARRAAGSRRGAGPRGAQMHARGQDHHARVLIDLEDAINGATRRITLEMPELDSEGYLRTRQRELSVRIPAGVREGQQIRLSGQGAPGLGTGTAGDLYLEVSFRPHRLYRVDGRDLYFDLPVAPWEAALGATVQVPTPGGSVGLKVPPGSATGRKLRLKGRGIPGQPPGDLYAVLQIVLPPANDEAARASYAAFAQAFDFNPRAALEG
jgi:curved DNA-binding protein